MKINSNMKHFFTLGLFVSALSLAAQNPNYDPDSNGDNLIGAEDLVSLLGVYNTSVGVDSTLDCEYEGTVEDEWLFGLFTGEIILDSVVVQYSISDSADYYEVGCPTAQTFYLNVEMQYTLFPNETWNASNPNVLYFQTVYSAPWGSTGLAFMRFEFQLGGGYAGWRWDDANVQNLYDAGPDGAYFNIDHYTAEYYSCINRGPSSTSFTLGEDGLKPSSLTCGGYEFSPTKAFGDPAYNYLNLLPFWHYSD